MARIQPSSENYSSDTAYWAARDMFDDVLFQINVVTDAETEYIPMVHGHWIEQTVSSGRDSWQCSVCGRKARGKRENLPYCHCGAKMNESEDNNNA